MTSWVRRTSNIHLLLVGALFAIQAGLSTYLSRTEQVSTDRSSERQALKWNPEVFRALVFGHWPAAVDWLWIRSLTDSSIRHVSHGEHAAMYFDADMATDLDPAFLDLYIAGASVLDVIRDDVEGARALLLKAERFRLNDLSSYPKSFQDSHWDRQWAIPLLLAYVYLFELNDIKTAAVYFREASEIPGSPDYLKSLARRFEKPGGEYAVGIRLLNFMLESAHGDAREKLEKRLHSLELSAFLFHLNRAFADYRAKPSSSRMKLEMAWDVFRTQGGAPSTDAFGGRLSIDASGKIVSSTPHEKVFGLE